MKKFALASMFTVITLIAAGCSSSGLSTQEEIQGYSVMNASQIQEKVNEIVNSHNEYDDATKEKIKTIVSNGIHKNQELKAQQSKLSQLFLDVVLSKNPKKGELNKIKKDIKKVYKQKQENFEKTASELKKVTGVTKENEVLSHEIFPYLNR